MILGSNFKPSAFNTPKPFPQISAQSFTVYGQRLIYCVASCVICDDVVIYYARISMGQVTTWWTLWADTHGVGPGGLNAKGLIKRSLWIIFLFIFVVITFYYDLSSKMLEQKVIHKYEWIPSSSQVANGLRETTKVHNTYQHCEL